MKISFITILVVQILLALSPLLPLTSAWWRAESHQQLLSNVIVFIGIEVTLTIILIGTTSLQQSSGIEATKTAVDSALPGGAIRPLKDYEFYTHFRSSVELASHSVSIAYLANYPPRDVQSRERRRYYDEITEIMKRRTQISFRRLVRQSAANRAWVGEMLNEFRNKPNIEIAVLEDPPEEEEMPLALSVQVVDTDKTWIVATRSHELAGEFRDIYIENRYMALAAKQYYERLWSRATKVLDRGRITAAGDAYAATEE